MATPEVKAPAAAPGKRVEVTLKKATGPGDDKVHTWPHLVRSEFLCAIVVFPLGNAFWTSLQRVRGLRSTFVGFANYATVLSDSAFWHALWTSFLFTGIAVSLVNYADELPYLCDEVLPRLERAGLRQRQ